MSLERFISTNQKDFPCHGNAVLFPPRFTTLNPKSFEMEMDDWMKLPESRIYRETDCTCKLPDSKLLDDLYATYPPIYDALKRAPPGYLNARVDRDRFKTTNKIDYGNLKPKILPKVARDVLKYFEPPEKAPCSGVVSPYDQCQTKPSRARKINGITGPLEDQLAPKLYREEIVFLKEKNNIRPFGGSTEYKDGICKVGENIIREFMAITLPKNKKPDKNIKKEKTKCETYENKLM